MTPRERLRKLWTDHVLWTRQAIVSVAHGLPDLEAVMARLMQNQDQIGEALVPVFGVKHAQAMARLLHEHIEIAAALLAGLRQNAPNRSEAALRLWRQNADSMAALLHDVNPAWPEGSLRRMLHDHLDLTIEEARARFAGDYAADIRAFDRALVQALGMADMMAIGR